MRNASMYILAILGLLVLSAVAGEDWVQQTPPSSPGDQYWHDMACLTKFQTLMFGGVIGGWSDETWLYDLAENTWTSKYSMFKPDPRYGHAMAHIGDGIVLLFGGNDGAYDDNTWYWDMEWDHWLHVTPIPSPSGRYYHAMAYIGDDKVLLFGGNTGSLNDETWVFDFSEATWTQMSPSSKPSARSNHAIAYLGGDRVLLFGGNDGSTDDETWIYDLSENTWTQQVTSSQPSARTGHAMAYLGAGRVVLFGGYDDEENGETWIYDSNENDWDGDGNYTRPSPRYLHGFSETSMDGSSELVLFGGYDADHENDETWTFGGGDHLLIAPNIVSVEDVPNDQGRKVALLWQRSHYDIISNPLITYYSIWRKYPESTALEGMGMEWDGLSLEKRSQLIYRRLETDDNSNQTKDDFWEFIGVVDAHFFDNYAYIATTLEDSSGAGTPYFTFLVSAHTSNPIIFWDSVPESGYSVDDINPSGTELTIQGLGGAPMESVRLNWTQVFTGTDGSFELGLIKYRIYCDIDPYFTPDAVNLLTTTSLLTYDHSDPRIGDPSVNLYYLIIALDGSDNESVSSNRVGEFDY